MIGLFKIFGPLLGKIAAGPVLQIIDKLVPDADLRTRLKAEIRNGLARRDIALTAARRAAVLTELRSDSWMTRSWRPALMFLLMIFLLFFGLLLPLMEFCLGQPLPVEPHLDRLPEPLWNLLSSRTSTAFPNLCGTCWPWASAAMSAAARSRRSPRNGQSGWNRGDLKALLPNGVRYVADDIHARFMFPALVFEETG